MLASVGFRLWVRHGCLCLDGGDALPFADPFPLPVQRSGTSVRCDEIELPDWAVPPPIDPDGCIPPEQPVWLDVPNGQYQAIVHTFDWGEQTGVERCPSYTVVLTPTDEWEAIAHPQSIPCLIEGEGLIEISPAIEDVPPRMGIIPDTEYALFEWKTPVFPGIDLSFNLTSEQFQTLEKIARQYLRAKIFEHHIIMGYGLTEGRIGTFFHVPTFGNVYDNYFLKGSFTNLQLHDKFAHCIDRHRIPQLLCLILHIPMSFVHFQGTHLQLLSFALMKYLGMTATAQGDASNRLGMGVS